ncbi:galactose oxidase early set domain-containing protein [Streptomyces sp. NBC_00091]|uniref:galactose oxidase early set domain-containing protein n=1 Tax=Streptomyces sp. NBC_00091 TaxID=2975648 RepID=UPI002255C827|nr:galactose oxidase early set domain-containing protein [Streptomyces sp. NBC_00091]MCX5379309.1 galactose oxidase early set domain-containing protein [Streptomyces sp. NBC_00091]
MPRRGVARALVASTVLSLFPAGLLLGPGVPAALSHDGPPDPATTRRSPAEVRERVRREISPQEARNLGPEHAEAHARTRLALRDESGYPDTTRVARLRSLTQSQARTNAGFRAEVYGAFKEYFDSPDFAAHIALLPTGKVLLFSFERIETNPQKEPAPTNVIGERNAGRAFLWDPAKGTGGDAFKKVTPPVVDMPDGTHTPRPAPFFCAGHSFLPNGMLGVFGGNLGGNGGSGAKLSLVFDPWTETWSRNQDMSTGRWYPSVVTGADGRQLIFSGQSELGWGTPNPVVERFPALGHPVPHEKTDLPRNAPVDRFTADAPFTRDYPQLFSLRDGLVYGLGREAAEQWTFDPADATRADLPARPDGILRSYGGAVPLPGGFRGPEAALVIGGDRTDPRTFKLSGGRWSVEKPRAFGRTQDNTLLMPDGTLLTASGAYDIRDYGNGLLNPNADLKYRQLEMRDTQGGWRLGPVQRLPRGYHSNALVLPDGRVMITGDELQQIANDADIHDDMNGTIEIYEPAYLHQGPRPALDGAPSAPLAPNARFQVRTSTPDRVQRAVLLAPTTATHAVNTSQRHVELRIRQRAGEVLTLQAPPTQAAAPPGHYMLFLLDAKGVPSVARWVRFDGAAARPPLSDRR